MHQRAVVCSPDHSSSQDIQASAVWVFVAPLSSAHRSEARRQSWPRLFLRSYDAGVAEWHAELDQHPWAQRLMCTCESDTLPPSAVPWASGGSADDHLARTSVARSYTELNDVNQLTTSSLAAALGRRALQLHHKKGGHVTAASEQAFSSSFAGGSTRRLESP